MTNKRGKERRAYTPEQIRDYAKKIRYLVGRMAASAEDLEKKKIESVEFFGNQIISGIQFVDQFVKNCDAAIADATFWNDPDTAKMTDAQLDALLEREAPLGIVQLHAREARVN